jgi:hypothetical protein
LAGKKESLRVITRKSKKTSRAKPTCMKCYEIGHKVKQCTNENATEAEIEMRKKEWI